MVSQRIASPFLSADTGNDKRDGVGKKHKKAHLRGGLQFGLFARLYRVVQLEFHGMGGHLDTLNIFALQRDVRVNEVIREHTTSG